jgi:hypothetical protein
VWSAGYRAVWHLDGDATAPLHDSTGRGNDATAHHCEYFEDDNASGGKTLGGAQRFDGVSDDTNDRDRVEVSSAGFQDLQTALTIEARARYDGTDTVPNAFPHVLGAGTTAADSRIWQLYWNTPGWYGRLSVGGALYTVGTADDVSAVWVSLALVYDGQAVRVYRDGLEIGSAPVASAGQPLDLISSATLLIGNNPVIASREFKGGIDEVRISEVARTPDWLSAQHAAQSDPTFATLSAVENR